MARDSCPYRGLHAEVVRPRVHTVGTKRGNTSSTFLRWEIFKQADLPHLRNERSRPEIICDTRYATVVAFVKCTLATAYCCVVNNVSVSHLGALQKEARCQRGSCLSKRAVDLTTYIVLEMIACSFRQR